jgi:hypothetical protein
MFVPMCKTNAVANVIDSMCQCERGVVSGRQKALRHRLETKRRMQRRKGFSVRDPHQDARPSTRLGSTSTAHRTGTREEAASPASAASPIMLTAVSPKHAWREQLKSAGASEVFALRDGKWSAAAKATMPTAQDARSSDCPAGRESSVDRILKSSVKQHTFAYAPFRLPFTLEAARSPYEMSASGIDQPVQIRRDVKDSVGAEEYACSCLHVSVSFLIRSQIPQAARCRRACTTSASHLREQRRKCCRQDKTVGGCVAE